jgi:hypothetical protein
MQLKHTPPNRTVIQAVNPERHIADNKPPPVNPAKGLATLFSGSGSKENEGDNIDITEYVVKYTSWSHKLNKARKLPNS